MSSYIHYKLLTDFELHEPLRRQPGAELFGRVLEPVRQPVGVPVALAGVIFFMVILLVAGVGARPTSAARESAAAYSSRCPPSVLQIIMYPSVGVVSVTDAVSVLRDDICSRHRHLRHFR